VVLILHHDDALVRLKSMDADSVDSLITDPPAGISFMGKQWDSGNSFIPTMSEIFKECLRVMKPGAHGLVWALPRTSHWTATALENAGFEIRDVVTHLFGSGFPKSHNLEKSAGLKGFGTALKPAAEMWILCRKPCSEKTVAKNVEKWFTGGLNIGASRIKSSICEKTPEPTAASIAGRKSKPDEAETLTSFAGESVTDNQESGESTTHSDSLIKPDIFDLNIGVTKAENTDTSLNTDTFGKTKTARSQMDLLSTIEMKSSQITESKTSNLCGDQTISECTQEELISTQKNRRKPTTRDDGNKNTQNIERDTPPKCAPPAPDGRWPSNLLLSHTIFCTDTECDPECAVKMLDAQSIAGGMHSAGKSRIKEVTSEYSASSFHASKKRQMNRVGDSGGASRFFYCAKASKKDRGEGNSHPTVKSLKLMEYLITLITPPKGIVLDPFMGSGSTGVAAKTLGFKFIGIEKEKEYFEIADKRIG
jgi:hypothetical protein